MRLSPGSYWIKQLTSVNRFSDSRHSYMQNPAGPGKETPFGVPVVGARASTLQSRAWGVEIRWCPLHHPHAVCGGFALEWQHWIVALEALRPIKPTIYTVRFFPEEAIDSEPEAHSYSETCTQRHKQRRKTILWTYVCLFMCMNVFIVVVVLAHIHLSDLESSSFRTSLEGPGIQYANIHSHQSHCPRHSACLYTTSLGFAHGSHIEQLRKNMPF